MAKTEVDRTQFNRLLDELGDLPNELVDEALEYFVDKTPKRSGNARRNTSARGNTILADYPYAGRLDEGYSKQAPNGMSKPTLEHFQKLVNERTRRL